jgi:hypothetical protein
MVAKALTMKDQIARYFIEHPNVKTTLGELTLALDYSPRSIQQAMSVMVKHGELPGLKVAEKGQSWWLFSGEKKDAEPKEVPVTEPIAREEAKQVIQRTLDALMDEHKDMTLEASDMMLIIGQTSTGKLVLQDTSGRLYKAKEM